MFKKIVWIMASLVIGGIVLVIISHGSSRSHDFVQNEVMIVLNDDQRKIEDSDSKSIAITTQAEAIEVSIPAPKQNNNRIAKASSEKNVSTKKPIFDTTKYKNKNISNESFFIPMTILYKHQLLPKSDDEIDTNHLTQLAKSLPNSDIPVILDIEHWNVHTLDDTIANKNIDKYILVIDTMKKARPDLKFGYYGVLPNRDYWAPVSNSTQKLEEWNRINKRLKRLANHVDVVCPSLYTFYDDPVGWKKYALENIKRAREYGKPVYPFLWPQYHDSNKILAWKYIDIQSWNEELNLVYDLADGIIIWGGRIKINGKKVSLDWNENEGWWQETKRFINIKIQI